MISFSEYHYHSQQTNHNYLVPLNRTKIKIKLQQLLYQPLSLDGQLSGFCEKRLKTQHDKENHR